MRVSRGAFGFISTGRERGIKLRLSRALITAVILLLSVASVAFISRTSDATPPCPCNVFTSSQPSSVPSLYSQPGGIEIGFKFTAEINGYISGVRFYKVAGMTGTHTGSLWNASGQRIAQAIFTSEGASGWQQVDFGPVAVTANTIYTASVFMSDGGYPATSNYFTSDIVNTPLSAPRDGFAGDALARAGQGVYDVSGASAYPSASFNQSNYWVDVSFIASLSTVPPTVTAKSPVADATNVPLISTATATFDGQLDPSTVNPSTVTVKDSQNNTVSGAVSYDSTTQAVIFSPAGIWQANKTYTVTIKGGTGVAVADMQGYKLAVDHVWSFTTTATELECPCSFKNGQAPTGSTSYRSTTSPDGIEVGLKVVPKTNGYITALRFYKPIITPDTTHIGNVWNASGVKLATATFTNESDYGWQEVKLSSPLSVTQGQLYIISYGMTTANYQAMTGSFTQNMTSSGMIAYPSGDSLNAATGSGTYNSVYSGTANTYPSSGSLGNDDYFVDAVFAINSTDASPLGVTTTQPSSASYGVARNTTIKATFDQHLDSATLSGATVIVKNSNNIAVSGTIAYDSKTRTVTVTPNSPLAYNTTYTVTFDGQIQDSRGVNLGTDYSWSFTTGSPPISDMNNGNGGPVLIVTTAANPYSSYYAEILRTEGMNYFDVKDSSLLSAATLAQYKTVILTEMPVTQTQVDTVSSWVNGGGNLVAMRPDKKFAGLLGLTDVSTTATNQYLRTNIASPAGIGIVDDTIQFKGTADVYNTNGADVVARLYSDATTATSYPAATTRGVGVGTAMSFTYDLAKSVIGLHQGNQAWAGQNRDADVATRTNDLFYGAMTGDVQPDWLDSTKMHIPQADEQQRLLANMITNAMKKSLPAPRFWYLPNDNKVALVLAGDDHNLVNRSGTEQAINNWLNESRTNCSVIDWQCVRASHYIFVGGELTNVRASQYVSYGFEVGDHLSKDGDCMPPTTYADLNIRTASDLALWRTKYTSLPIQQTSRSHCYAWNDWDSVPLVGQANGIRYDLTTAAYPSSWIGTRSPIVTGSGMNMRLTDANGALIDVRQGVTNFENMAVGVPSVNATFDNALGSAGYYGIFGSHYDMTDNYADTLVSIAKSRNIPIISSEQALQWLDGRNNSNFSNLTSSQQGKETFTIATGEGAHGLRAMVPTNDISGTLTQLTHESQAVTYQTEIIKGVSYAVFNAMPGDYAVTYSDYTASTPTPDTNTGSGSQTGGKTTNKKSNVATTTETATDSTPSSTESEPSTITEPTASTKPESASSDETTIQPLLVVGAIVAILGGGAAAWFLVIRRRLQ